MVALWRPFFVSFVSFSTKQNVQDHHKGKAQGKTDGADVGVLALGCFGDKFFDYNVEHCAGCGHAGTAIQRTSQGYAYDPE